MSANATGTPTTLWSLPKFNTASDAPNGKGVNEMMDALDVLLVGKPVGIAAGEVPVWDGSTFVRPTARAVNISALASYPANGQAVLAGDGTWPGLTTLLQSVNTYQNYTPALTATVTSPNLGAGSVVNGRWIQTGHRVHAYGRVIFGTGSTAGTGSYLLSLPVNWAATINDVIAGHVHLRDSSTGNIVNTQARFVGLTNNTVQMFYPNAWPAGAEQPVNASNPWTWADGDSLHFSFIYEA